MHALISAVDYIGMSLRLHLSKTCVSPFVIEFFPHALIPALSVITSGSSILLHLIKDLKGPTCHAALLVSTDHCTIGDHIGLQFILLHISQELQAFLVIAPFLHALTTAVDYIGMESLLLHLSKTCMSPFVIELFPHALTLRCQ